MKKVRVGMYAEELAETFLRKKGYEILCKNFKTRLGEIDIVASDNGCVVFVEVKYRSSADFGSALDAITKAKIKKIVQTASEYLSKFRLHESLVRFDVIAIESEKGEIEHIENAFESCLQV